MYTAYIDTNTSGIAQVFVTIREARAYAEEFGNTASVCRIYKGNKKVAEHRRDTSGDGMRWFKAEV